MLHNEYYMIMHYALDNATKNKGFLTLCSSYYVKDISVLFNRASKPITSVNQIKETVIPAKDLGKRTIRAEFEWDFEDSVSNMYRTNLK